MSVLRKPVPRKLRIALVVAVAFMALPAATVRAAARMPVGFYDDPSFRWSTDTAANLKSAQKANADVVHVLADWSAIAPTKPSSPLNPKDPAYHLADLDQFVRSAQQYGMQVLLTISQTPKWANGGQTPNHPPTNLNNLTLFAQMLATHYNGTKRGYGVVNMFSIWNEPNLELFLTPQFSGNTIVSPGIYAKLFMAGYKGIKKGNPHALVAAGETSNRGHNHPTSPASENSVAPATFAHDLAVANPNLPFDAWATHPYPSVYALGPGQRVAYPNVGFSTMSKFGASLKEWFHRSVPIWVTEYGEQTSPAAKLYGPISLAKQAADAKQVLELAEANPYVQMFIWFIFRDSTPLTPTGGTWSSGVETASGAKKPAYNAFAGEAGKLIGETVAVQSGSSFALTLPVPIMAYRNTAGKPIGVQYKIKSGSNVVASGDPLTKITANGTITFPVAFDAPKGKKATYTMSVVTSDRGGFTESTTVAIVANSTATPINPLPAKGKKAPKPTKK